MPKMGILVFNVLVAFLAGAQARWVEGGGPGGGLVRDVKFIGSDIFAGFAHGGIIRSRDGGMSWQAVNRGLAHLDIRSLAESGGGILALTSGGLYRSMDAGDSWSATGSWGIGTSSTSLVVTDKALFVLAYSGVYRSLDQGVTWKFSGPAMDQVDFESMTVMGGVVLVSVIGRGGGIFRSLDNGDTWLQAYPSTTIGAVYHFLARSDTLEAVGSGLYRSLDSGKTWTLHAPGGYYNPWLKIGGAYYASNDDWLNFGIGAYRSDDDGRTWTHAWPTLQDSEVKIIAGKAGILLVGTEGGLYRSSDGGGSWTKAEAGLRNASVNSLAARGTTLFAATWGGMYAAPAGAPPWQARNTGLWNANMTLVLPHESTLFAATLKPGMFRSLDQGATWSRAAGLDSNKVFDILPHGGRLLAATSMGLYTSVDGGATWAKPGPNSSGISAFCLADLGDEVLIGSGGFGVFKTADYQVFAPSNRGMGNYFVRDFLVSDSFILAATQGWGIFRSVDRGQSWNSVTAPGTVGEVWVLVRAGHRLFAGAGLGIFHSVDGGVNWGAVNEGMPASAPVRSLAVVGDTLFAGTLGYGVWKRAVGDIPLSVRPRRGRETHRRIAGWGRVEDAGWRDAQGRSARARSPSSPGVRYLPSR